MLRFSVIWNQARQISAYFFQEKLQEPTEENRGGFEATEHRVEHIEE